MSCKPTTLASRYAYTALQRNDYAFRKGLSEFDTILKQDNPALYFDREDLLSLTGLINRLKTNNKDLESFPYLNDRLQQRAFSYIDTADFLNQSGYSPENVIRTLNGYYGGYNITVDTSVDMNNLLGQLEDYNLDNVAASINGGTCGAISNPFSKLGGILSKIQNAMDLIRSIQDFDIGSLIGPLSSIKKVLEQVVDKLKDTLMTQLSNITGKISGLVEKAKDLGLQALSHFRRMLDNVKNFLSDTSIESIKGKINEFLAKSISQFEEVTPEVLSLLLFRFCQFSEMLQSFMQAPVKALNQQVTDFESNVEDVERQGLAISQGVVENGGRRIRTREIDRARGRLSSLANNPRSQNRGIGSPNLTDTGLPAAASGLTIPRYVEDGQISREQADAILNMTETGIPGYATFGRGVNRMIAIDTAPDGSDGWKRVKDEVWVRLVKALDMAPQCKPVTINSAYRSYEYNRSVGGAGRSIHMSGGAIDVAYPNDTESFIAACSIQGFLAIQPYDNCNFVHIDISRKRTWTGGTNCIANGTGGRYGALISAHINGNMTQMSDVVANVNTQDDAQDSDSTDPTTVSPEEEAIIIDENGVVQNPEADPEFTALHNAYLARARRATSRS